MSTPTWSRSRHPTSNRHRVPVGMLDYKLDAVARGRLRQSRDIRKRPHRIVVDTGGRNAEFTHRLRGRWRLIRDGVQLAAPAGRKMIKMIWSRDGTWRPGSVRDASNPPLTGGCVAGLPRQYRFVCQPPPDAPARSRHDGRPQLGSSLCRTVLLLPCRGARLQATVVCARGRLQPRMRGSHCCAGRFAGNRQIIACGYSMGSLIAQLLWRRHPGRIRWTCSGCHLPQLLGSP
jgi:hypothetical protein